MHRVFAFLAPGELKGATILRIWLPCAIQTCGTQALVVPFSYYFYEGCQCNYMHHFWHNNSKPVKGCAAIMAGAMAYLFFIDGESFSGWTVFFIALALTVLFHTMDEQNKEIESLRKNGNEDEDIKK